MAKSNYDVAHAFFYATESGTRYGNLWYSKGWSWEEKKGILMKAYSYSTVIAQIRLNKQGRKVMVISDCNYSHATTKHLSLLRSACPFNYIYVPYVEDNVDSAFSNHFDHYTKGFDENEFRRQENRMAFLRLLRMFDEYDHEIGSTAALRKTRKCATIKRLEQLCKDINESRKNVANLSPAAIKRHEQALAKAKKERERRKKIVEQFQKSKDKNEMLAAAFHYDYYMDEKTKAIREALTKGNGYAYAWLDTDCNKVCTSKHVSVNADEVAAMLRLWHAKESICGQKIGYYTIVENNTDHVKIGCHTIPLWNVQMLYNKLIG